jgi:regulator of replication initiation timing
MSKNMKEKEKPKGDKNGKQQQKKKMTPAEEEEERKRQIDEQIEKERGRFLEQMEDLVKELEKIKLENEKLRRQQDQTHGGPVDTVDKMKKELERAKATNKFLLSDIETRKNQCHQLETQVFEMNMKSEGISKKTGDLLKENHKLKVERESLMQEKQRNLKLMEENRKLRQFLSSNRIDAKSGRPLIEMLKKRTAENRNSKPVPVRSFRKPEVVKKLKYQSKSLEDLEQLREFYNTKTYRSADHEKEPPSYLGNYMDIMRQKKLQNKKPRMIMNLK